MVRQQAIYLIILREIYKFIEVDLRKQRALDVDPEALQQINFTGNLYQTGKITMFFILDETKETILDTFKETVEVF